MTDILLFVTRADYLSQLGFPHNCEIQFYDQEPESQRIPYSSTCALILYLPKSITEDVVFKDLMQMSIKVSVGFGKVLLAFMRQTCPFPFQGFYFLLSISIVSLGRNCCSAVLYSSLFTMLGVINCNLACPYFIYVMLLILYIALIVLSI